MRRMLCLLAGLCLCLPGWGGAEDGSWGQINQSLAPGAGWQQVVTDPSAFQLGEAAPWAGGGEVLIADWGSYPSIDGSTVCVPMAMEAARQWLALPEADLNGFVSFSTTPVAYARLAAGAANPMVTIPSRGWVMDDTHPIDLVLGTAPSEDERARLAASGVSLQLVPVCYDAFVFLVNADNPVENLSSRDIRAIYSGRALDWGEVGGTAGQLIAAYQRPHGSGSQTAMEELVMKGLRITAAEPNYISGGMAELIEQVGSYDNALNALGYSYLYYVEGLYKSGSVKVLSVDGTAPTPENLRSGAYPYTVCYYAAFDAGNDTAARFAAWLASDEGQRCVAQAGYVPVAASLP